MPTRYFVRRSGSEPWYVFRILPDVSVEVYDVGVHAWTPRPLEPLYRWAGILGGEIGIDAISERLAVRLIDELTLAPAAGRRRGADRLRPPAA